MPEPKPGIMDNSNPGIPSRITEEETPVITKESEIPVKPDISEETTTSPDETISVRHDETSTIAGGIRSALWSEFMPEKRPVSENLHKNKTVPKSVVKISNLVKDYRVSWLMHKKFRALNGVSFEVKSGEIFGFLGPNGAGKTTVIKCLLGIANPTDGTVEAFGARVGSKSVLAHVGYFPETSYYHWYLTAREAVLYYGRLFGIHRRVLSGRTDWILDMVGLYPHRNKLLSKFSKGMLQRVGLAQALINDPALLIMDEPTSGLDPVMKKEMRNLIINLNSQGKTIFFSSHELSEVETICHRVAILDKGKVVAQGPLSNILPTGSGMTVVAESLPAENEPEFISRGVSVKRENNMAIINCPNNETVYDIVAMLRQNNCRLIEVRAYKQRLEDFFLGTVQKSNVEGA